MGGEPAGAVRIFAHGDVQPNLAVTSVSALIVNVHVAEVPEHGPSQPSPKPGPQVEPGPTWRVRVTEAPAGMVAEHVPEDQKQLMPPVLDVTLDWPLPKSSTVTFNV